MPMRKVSRQRSKFSVTIPKLWIEQFETTAKSKVVAVQENLINGSIVLTPLFEKEAKAQ